MLKRMSEEGTASAFIARLFSAMLDMRDQFVLIGLYGEEWHARRKYFDSRYGPVFDSAQAMRDAAVQALQIIADHKEAIQSGKAVRYFPDYFEILQTVDIPLGQAVDKVITEAVVALKTGLQAILRDPLGLDIGFLFQRDVNFQAGVTALRAAGENVLASYVEDVRTVWLSDLLDLRNQYEHHGWSLGEMEYERIGTERLEVTLPRIQGMPVDEFVRRTANRVLLFIENMMVYAMSRNFNHPIYVIEIPSAQRDADYPKRFAFGGKGLHTAPAWVITYSDILDFV